ncbi:MAG: hypothetical protein HYT80_08250 [Euryarchaeota archaeon]|nr:hypothetical protein [Euryarchaeota archaeon]
MVWTPAYYTPKQVVDEALPELKALLTNPPPLLPQAVKNLLRTIGQEINGKMQQTGLCETGTRECYDVWTGEEGS